MPESKKVSKTKRPSPSKATKKSRRPQALRHALNIDGRSVLIGRSFAELRHCIEGRPPIPREQLEQECAIAIELNRTQAAFCNLLQTCPTFSEGLITEHEAARFLKSVTLLKESDTAIRDQLPGTMQRYLNALAATRLSNNGLLAVDSKRLREVILGRAPSEHSREEWIELITGAIAVQHMVLDKYLDELRVKQDAILHGHEQTLARASALVEEALDLVTTGTEDRLQPWEPL